jgi:copper(I)-binding protein
MRKFIWSTCLATALLASVDVYAGDIEISGAWARASASTQDAGAVDMTITSKHAATLVGASTPASKTVELHRMWEESGMMKMREVKAIELPAGKPVNLHESGYHLMLIGLKAPLKEGATVPLTLNIKVENQGVVDINTIAEVKSLTATKPTSDDDHMHMQMK